MTRRTIFRFRRWPLGGSSGTIARAVFLLRTPRAALILAVLGAAGGGEWANASPQGDAGGHSASRVVREVDWARLLVRGLGWESEGFPPEAPEGEILALLTSEERIELDPARPTASLGGAGEGPKSLLWRFFARTSGRYTLKLLLEGPGLIVSLDDRPPFLVRGSGGGKPVDSREFRLPRGSHRLSVTLPGGGRIAGIELTGACNPRIEPLGGWHPERALTFASKAVTLVKAARLESLLPLGPEQGVAREGGGTFAWEVARAGVYSVVLEGEGVVGSTLDACPSRPVSAVSLAGIDLYTGPLSPGTHRIALVPPSSRARVRVFERRASGSDYLKILEDRRIAEGELLGSVRLDQAEVNVASVLGPVQVARVLRSNPWIGGIPPVAAPDLPSDTVPVEYRTSVSPWAP